MGSIEFGPRSSAFHDPYSRFFSLNRSTMWVMKAPNMITAAERWMKPAV